MKVSNYSLFNEDGKQVPFKKSPNIGGKLKSRKYLIIHYTGTSSASSAINWMLDPKAKVSAHLHLDKEGNFVQLVKFDDTAWHVGASAWLGLIGLNSHTIGIEISNNGSEPYTQKQLDSLVEAGIALNEAYNFDDILGHSEVATPKGRKVDPGPKFPMQWFKDKVLKKPSIQSDTYKTSADLNLRDGAGTQYKVLSVLPKGTELNIVDVEGDWRKVFVCSNKLLGFVSSKYLIK